MIGILIIAHGNLGESLLECAQHVVGKKPQQMACLNISSNDDPASILPRAIAKVQELNTGSGVLVLSDMYGATPCNIVGKLLQPGSVEGVAGINLPMLIRTITYQDEPLKTLIDKAVSGGREGVVHFTQESCERYN